MDYLYKGSTLTLAQLKATLNDEVALIRQNTLDKFQRHSPGVSRVYQENLIAAQRYTKGEVTPMSNGMTPTAYLTGLGAPLGLHASQFAAYILSENQNLGLAAYSVEQQYLVGKGLFATGTDGDAMIAWIEGYRATCNGIGGA